MYHILVCDDEKDIVSALTIYLTTGGYQVFPAYDGVEALSLLEREEIHLVLLDIMMPKLDGIATLRKIRERSNVPVIFLTAKSEDVDKIQGLNLGADDYVTKPFNPVVLGAKVKALIRRSKGSRGGDRNLLIAGPFRYNTSTLRFYKGSQEIVLSSKENAIMKLFMDNVNRIFSKDMIYDLIWGEAIIDENAIMVYINRLRQKIEDDPAKPRYIQTVRGLGYRFVV